MIANRLSYRLEHCSESQDFNPISPLIFRLGLRPRTSTSWEAGDPPPTNPLVESDQRWAVEAIGCPYFVNLATPLIAFLRGLLEVNVALWNRQRESDHSAIDPFCRFHLTGVSHSARTNALYPALITR